MSEGSSDDDNTPLVVQTSCTIDELGGNVKMLVDSIIGPHEGATFLERACLELTARPEWPQFPPECYRLCDSSVSQHPQVPRQEKGVEQGTGAQIVPGL